MRSRWLIVALLWMIPAVSLATCPYDLHGAMTCSNLSKSGRTISYYITWPGLFLGAALSGILRHTPQEGESLAAIAAGVLCWMVLLSIFVLCAPRIFGSMWSGRGTSNDV